MRRLWRLRGGRAVGSIAAVLAGLMAAALRAGEDSRVLDANRVEPVLGTSGPWRRLGDSEFRLELRDGRRRPFIFSPDGALIAAANWDQLLVWNFPSGKLVCDLSDAIDADCIAFSADGKQLIALERRQMEIHRFDIASGKLAGKTQLKDVVDEEGHTRYWLSHDGKWLATTEVYEHVTVWNTSTGDRQLRMQMQRMEPYYAPTTKDDVLVLWDNLFIERYDLANGKMLSSDRHYRQRIGLISNSEGTVMAAYSSEDKAIIFWNPATNQTFDGKIPLESERHWQPDDAALSSDGKRFVYWQKNGEWEFERKIAVFDVATGKLVRAFAPPDVYFVDQPVISPNGRYVFPAGGRSVFRPIDVDDLGSVPDGAEHVLAVESLSFTPDGESLIVGSGDKRQAWRLESAERIALFEQWYHHPHVVAVNNERALVSGVRDGGARLQEIRSGKVLREFEPGSHTNYADLQLAPDGRSFVTIASKRDGRFMQRWNLETGIALSDRKLPSQAAEEVMYDREQIIGLLRGGLLLCRLDVVKPPQKLESGNFDFGEIELVLENWETGRTAHRLNIPSRTHLVVSLSDVKHFAACVADDWSARHERGGKRGSVSLIVWDLEKGVERFRVVRNRKTYFTAFSLLTISADGRLVASASERDMIEVWDGKTGVLLQRFDAGSVVAALEFSEDGGRLASGQRDGSVLVWETRSAATRVKR